MDEFRYKDSLEIEEKLTFVACMTKVVYFYQLRKENFEFIGIGIGNN